MGEFNQTVDLPNLIFQKLNIGPYSNNVYVLTCKKTKECVIIDTSHSAPPILSICEGSIPKYILQTHCHGDHINALDEVRRITGAPMGQHPEDSREFGTQPDFEINDGDEIAFGNISLKAIHTPGHCRGMLMFFYQGHCVCGDTIFPGGPGKTWNYEQLLQSIESIKNKVLTLPSETVLYPGHGANSTVARSQKELADFEMAGRPKPGEFGDITWAA